MMRQMYLAFVVQAGYAVDVWYTPVYTSTAKESCGSGGLHVEVATVQS